MLDHVGFNVSDYARSKAFYFFWLDTRKPAGQAAVHVAFAVESRATVDAFHAAALQAGATDNGAPGVRAIYHPDYYSAYVLDPDGNNVAA